MPNGELVLRVVKGVPDLSKYGKVFIIVDGKLCSVSIGEKGLNDWRWATPGEFADHFDTIAELFQADATPA